MSVATVFAALLAQACCISAACAEGDLSEIAAKGSASARWLRTIDCTFESEGGYFHHYLHDGEKYRIEYWKKGTFGQPDQRPALLFAYDGDNHYRTNGRVIKIAVPEPRPIPIAANPLFLMYEWLFFANDNYTWATVRDLDAWMNAFAHAQVVGDEEAAGVPCRKVDVDFEKGRVTVWFAVELGCTPMKWTSVLRDTGEPLSDAIVMRYRTVDTSVGRIALPLSTSSRHAYNAAIDEASLRLNEQIDPALFAPAIPAEEPLAKAVPLVCRDAKLNAMRALVVLEGDKTKSTVDLASRLLDTDDTPDARAYRPLSVSVARQAKEVATIAAWKWPHAEAGEVVLLVLDDAAQIVANQRLKSEQSDAAYAEGQRFLSMHRPAPRDAQELLTAARDEARAGGRRLWVVDCGPRCGSCFRLTRWMDDQRAVLEKDYVLVKVMGSVDKNYKVVRPLLPGSQSQGIPYHAIVEPDGTVLVTSKGPNGNIGMPSGAEGILHLKHMLEQTAQRITGDDIATLAKSLEPQPSK
jgi:hypothetical protein